jgi:hypothetical protein
MEHRAPVKLLHLLLWFAKTVTSLQVFPISVISSSIVLLQDFLGRPLLLARWVFQYNTSISIAPANIISSKSEFGHKRLSYFVNLTQYTIIFMLVLLITNKKKLSL